MTGNSERPARRNLLLIALLAAATLFAAYHEGFLPKISGLFWVLLAAGFSISTWLATSVSTRRLLALILGTYFIEYVKEAIGIQSDVWTYHGIGSQFTFGVWAWVLAGLVTYALATRVAARLVRKLRPPFPRWLNPLLLLLVASLVPLTLGDYWDGVGISFVLFYALVLAVGLYASARMDFAVFAGVVVTSWIVANPSEYVGSVSSGVWTFNYNPDYPPFFLLFGCWPLEILAQYSLSAFLSGEPLDQDNS